MKTIKYIIIAAFAFLCASCEKETEGVSWVTDLAKLELKGSSIVFMPVGGTIDEPGYTATENGVDVTDKVVVAGNIEPYVGVYSLRYTIKNKDGVPTNKYRTLYVYDATESPVKSGVYTTTPDSYRVSAAGTQLYGAAFPVMIMQEKPGIFTTTDFLGGWYEQRAGYGSAYAMTGKFRVNADNTISLIQSHIDGWGDGLDRMTNGRVDPATGNIYWEVGYAGSMTFYITYIFNE